MMKKQIASWAVWILAFSFLSCFASAQENSTTAKNFTLRGLDKSSFTLSAYKDKKPVLLFFWTTWCPFCRQELKVINDKYQQIIKDGVELAVINVQESAAKVENFVQGDNFSFRILLDSDADVAQSFGLVGIPTYFLIDKQGIIRFEGNSFPEEEYKRLTSE